MGTAAQELLDSALALTPQERAIAAAKLIISLDDEADPAAEFAWADEIARRIEEIDSGTVKLVPWEEARRIIRGDESEPASA